MNLNTPFDGQPPGGLQAPSKSSPGITQVQPPLQFGQISLFGPNSGGGVKNPGFTPSSDFTRTSELCGPLGQTLGFGQPLGFTQSYPSGHTTSFMAAAKPTSSSAAGFSFKLPTNPGTSQASSKFGNTSGEKSGSVFMGQDISFKTPENTAFKQVFGFGSGPEKTQSQTILNSFTFSIPGESRPGRLAPFGIPQDTSSSSSAMHFSFSKAVSNSTTLSSSFPATLPSKTNEDDKKGPINPFMNPSRSFAAFSHLSGGSSRPEREEFVTPSEPVKKGTKRKEKHDHSPRRRDYDTAYKPGLQSRSDYFSNKCLERLNWPQIGDFFDVTLQKSKEDNGRHKKKSRKGNGCSEKEPKMERVSLEFGELEQRSAAGGSQSGLEFDRKWRTIRRKEEEEKAKQKKKASVSNPLRQKQNSWSTETLGGLPLSELKAFMCRNIPDYFFSNKKRLVNYFKMFVKIHDIVIDRKKKRTIVHCLDHASAALAKAKAKELHEDVLTFWYMKLSRSGELKQRTTAGGRQSGLALERKWRRIWQREEAKKTKQKGKASVSNPLRQKRNSGSTESLEDLPSSELKAFQCKNIPDYYLSNRSLLENYFKSFAKIHRVVINRKQKRAIVHCLGHASAALARKKVKVLHKEIVTFWLTKKPKESVSNPLCQNWNRWSTACLGGLPSSKLTAFQCKNISDHYLNNRNLLENFFKSFVKVHRIVVNRKQKRAIVHCLDPASAALAKKKAKVLHKEIVTFWLTKKPNKHKPRWYFSIKKKYSPKKQTGDVSEGRQKNRPAESSAAFAKQSLV